MPMIRQSDREEIARDAVTLHLGDLMARGKALREEAQRRAQAIIDKAHAERQRILEGAHEKGFEAGRAEGLSAGYKDGFEKGHQESVLEATRDLDGLARGWESALEGFLEERQGLVDRAGADVLALVIQIAERVIKRSVEHDPAVVVGQIEHVLEVVSRPSRLVLKVHPADVGLVREVMPRVMGKFVLVKHAEVVEDGSLSRGSVVMMEAGQEAASVFDADVQRQLDRIAAAIVPGKATA
jgi:flagellar biosynthesis/type III secretory pathway protein FliH